MVTSMSCIVIAAQHSISPIRLVEQGLTSHQTH